MKLLKSIFVLFLTLLFLLGLTISCYPLVYGAVVDQQIQSAAQVFLDSTQETAQSSSYLPDISSSETTVIHHEELWDAMGEYNQEIWAQRQAGLKDPWSYQQPAFTLAEYGLEDEVFGVISIPKLDLEMPLYLGATNQHMADGAAILSQTSIPIGGKNTNCIIAGHRGWRGAAYFRNIPELQVGDTVTITNLWEELHYRVVETKIINPSDVKAVHIQENKDLITLLTCHPYASGGKQRFLVICERSDVPF